MFGRRRKRKKREEEEDLDVMFDDELQKQLDMGIC